MRHAVILSSCLAVLSGCASIATDSTQPISVSTTGCPNAKCEIKGEKVVYFVTTPGTVIVDKDHEDLHISCKHDDYETVTVSGTLKSKAGGWVFGNILFGGVIGVGIDLISGNAYEYPNHLQIPMECGNDEKLAGGKENLADKDSTVDSNDKTQNEVAGTYARREASLETNIQEREIKKEKTCDMVEIQPSVWDTRCF